eukprot:COSAG05_NODE_1441_length_4880_cov_3.567245_2_plen_104_part_00
MQGSHARCLLRPWECVTRLTPHRCSRACLVRAPAMRQTMGQVIGAGPQLYFPPELNVDYGVPTRLCKETSAGSEVFTSDFSQATVQIDCKAWEGSVKMEWERE